MQDQDQKYEVEQLQLNVLSGNLDVHLLARLKTASDELLALGKVEESFSRHKSRALRVQEGDSNTSYFHSMVKIKQNRQTIRAIVNQQVADEAIGFFTRLLGVSNSSITGCYVDLLKELLASSFSEEACQVF
ncbi:hypothetical protein V6N13_060876 [Hibiscus sabdariffa]